jgi:glucokinase
MAINKILAGDIGGSHLTLALFEQQNSELSLLDMDRVAVDASLSKKHILDQWVKSFKKLSANAGPLYVSLAMPAPFDYKNGVCLIKEQKKFKSLYGVDLKQELSEALEIPISNISFLNDAEAFMRGEAFFGKGKGYTSLLGLTLGTGLGSAVKKEDFISDAGLWNTGFKDGIAEDYFGTAWFVQWAKENAGIETAGLKDILDHPEMKEFIPDMFDTFAANLGDFLKKEYAEIDFEAVIIGGNISRASDLFVEKLRELLLSAGILSPILISELGEYSALYGAASIYFDFLKSRIV